MSVEGLPPEQELAIREIIREELKADRRAMYDYLGKSIGFDLGKEEQVERLRMGLSFATGLAVIRRAIGVAGLRLLSWGFWALIIFLVAKTAMANGSSEFAKFLLTLIGVKP